MDMGQTIFILAVIFLTVPQVLEFSALPDIWFASNQATGKENPAEIVAKIGENLTVPCAMEHNLKYFAWKFCHGKCASPKAKWDLVVQIYDGNITISNEDKFGVLPNGSLVVKNIQPRNNNNWARCFYKKRFVGMYHQSTVILIQDSPKITLTSVQQHVVHEHMNLFLECEVKSFPPAWVAWIWNNRVVQNKTDGQQQYFVRRHVTKNDDGNYTCMAGNYLGTANYTYQVTVRADVEDPDPLVTPGTHSTGFEPTREPKMTPRTHSTDTTKKAVERYKSLGAGIGYGILIGAIVVLSLSYVYFTFNRKTEKCRVVRPPNPIVNEGGSSGSSEDENYL